MHHRRRLEERLHGPPSRCTLPRPGDIAGGGVRTVNPAASAGCGAACASTIHCEMVPLTEQTDVGRLGRGG